LVRITGPVVLRYNTISERPMSISFITTDQREIDRVEPLWLKLNEYHKERSLHFKARYDTARFEKRKNELLQKSHPNPLNIQLAVDNQVLIGYCVSSVTTGGKGEIDSIWVEKAYRGRGIGDVFMQQALHWLEVLKARRKTISVGGGNESVFGFYRHYGFHPLVNTLAQIKPFVPALKTVPIVAITPGQLADLDLIRPLWENLQRYEDQVTPVFKGYFEKRSFDNRKTAILQAAASGGWRIDLVHSTDSETLAGYCISTISAENTGKIESIYLAPDYRGHGTGHLLMQNALGWMDIQHVERKILMAAAGNVKAIKFYARFNFFPVNTILQQE
jgi:ribosomal protein S18 acetylase RimI-like enzyme